MLCDKLDTVPSVEASFPLYPVSTGPVGPTFLGHHLTTSYDFYCCSRVCTIASRLGLCNSVLTLLLPLWPTQPFLAWQPARANLSEHLRFCHSSAQNPPVIPSPTQWLPKPQWLGSLFLHLLGSLGSLQLCCTPGHSLFPRYLVCSSPSFSSLLKHHLSKIFPDHLYGSRNHSQHLFLLRFIFVHIYLPCFYLLVSVSPLRI